MKTPRLWEAIIAVVVVGFILYLFVGWLLSRAFAPEGPQRRVSCLNNIKQLGLALKQYVEDYGDAYPWRAGAANPDEAWLDVGVLYPNYTSSWKTYLCPKSKDRPFEPVCALGDLKDNPLQPLLSRNSREVISYAYCIDASDPEQRTAWTENAPATVRLLADKKAGTKIGSPGNPVKMANHKDDGRNVLYHDGHVKWKPGANALDPDEDRAEVGDPNAADYKAWWSDPPYYGE
jgi:prepilin-type processing-associated H-X9-DG protein